MGEKSGDSVVEELLRGPNVLFTFAPNQSRQKDVLSVLGQTSEETKQNLARCIPDLRGQSPLDIVFGVPVSMNKAGQALNNRWAEVQDEAWPGLVTTPPKRMSVQLLERAGSSAERHVRRDSNTLQTIAQVIFIIFATVVMAACGVLLAAALFTLLKQMWKSPWL